MSSAWPLVSVIITTYNRCHYVQQAIKSVLAQSYPNFELIIVDDGSTDGTKQAVASLADHRVRYLWHENQGRSASRNRGVAESQGELIAFLDDDDLYYPNKLSAQVDCLLTHPDVGLAACGHNFITNDGRAAGERRVWEEMPDLDLKQSLFDCPLTPSAIMLRRTWFEMTDGFDPALEPAEDTDIFLHLFKAGCRLMWVPQILWSYRVHPSNSQQDGSRYMRARLATLDKLFADQNLPPDILAIRDQVYAHSYLTGAIQQFATGQAAQGREDLRRAVELDPTLLHNDSERIRQGIIGRIGDHNLSNPRSFVKMVFDNLPPEVVIPQRHRSETQAIAAKALFFRSYQIDKRRVMLSTFTQAVWHDPQWLRNRGVLSILLQGLLGFNPTRIIRRQGVR